MASSAVHPQPVSTARTRPKIKATSLRVELLAALTAAALATAIGVWVLELWKTNLRVPIFLGPGDFLFNLLVIKDVITHGWFLTNPNLAAPFGQQLYDFPAFSGDSFYIAIVKAVGIFSDNPAIVLNVFYLMGFPLIAGSAYAVLRRLGISIGAAMLCSVIYAVLPYRFESGELHVFLSSYFIVPVCCLLILAIFKSSELFRRDLRHKGLRAYLTWRNSALLLLCLLIGSADNYFALFTVVLAVMASLLAFLATRNWRPFIGSLLVSLLILLGVTLNGLPTIIYTMQHGSNNLPGLRLPQESDDLALSLANMVLPIEGNRVPALATLADKYDSTVKIPFSTPGSEATFSNLGLIGTLGLLWLVTVLGVSCLRTDKPRSADRNAVPAALAAGMAFLIGTVGGLDTIFAYVVNPQLHAPARISLFIAFFALFGAALALDKLARRIHRRTSRPTTVALFAVILLIGVLYQTSPDMVPDYAAQTRQYETRRRFVRAIESEAPGNASIFQIPYVGFPQSLPPGKIEEYEDLYPSIFSNRLRWSGGAVEGRPTDWVRTFLNKPLSAVLEGVSAIGFQGIYMDRAGLSESNSKSLPLALRRALGVTPLTSDGGRFMFFDMTAYNRLLRQRYSSTQIQELADAALYPS
jgi:hypothetical protein